VRIETLLVKLKKNNDKYVTDLKTQKLVFTCNHLSITPPPLHHDSTLLVSGLGAVGGADGSFPAWFVLTRGVANPPLPSGSDFWAPRHSSRNKEIGGRRGGGGGCNKIFQISYKQDQSSNFQNIIYIPPQHKTEGSIMDPVLRGPDLGPRMLFKNHGFGPFPFRLLLPIFFYLISFLVLCFNLILKISKTDNFLFF
jgi:hypothetical protein